MAKDDMSGLLVLGGIGVAAYVLYSNGTLASWFPSLFGTSTTPSSTQPVQSPAPGTGGSVVAAPAPTPTPSGLVPGADCVYSPPCKPGQACSALEAQGRVDANGVCQIVSLPISPATSVSTPVPPGAQTTLTVQDAAIFPYSSSVTPAQMNAVHAQLVSEFDTGQIPVIAGNSVLAYMLGWGGQAAGATETVNGESYSFDGSNWHLSTSGLSGFASTRVGMGWIHGGLGYRFRRAS